MPFGIQCPRCGQDFEGNDADLVATAVVDHARTAHRHDLDRDVILAHLAGEHPFGDER